VETVSGSTAGRYWAAAGQSNYIASVINQSGPGGGDARAYRFESNNAYGVSTYMGGVVPATNEFRIVVSFKTDADYSASQGHLFSNNNGSNAGRANLMVIGNQLGFFVEGVTGGGANISLDSGTNLVNDGQWHVADVRRDSSNNWSLYLDSQLMDTGTGSVSIEQTTYWMLGRQRNGGNPFAGEISDVKVYDVIPEPGTLSLLGIPLLGLLLRRRFRR
jgi:hypothetical protein